jgi:hypothetical protein
MFEARYQFAEAVARDCAVADLGRLRRYRVKLKEKQDDKTTNDARRGS